MATLEEIREGIAANLRTIPELQANGYMMSSPTPPAAEIVPTSVDFDLAMGRGMDEWSLTVRGFVAFGVDIGAQKRLDLWLAPTGPQSFKAAIESDTTLGGAVDDLRVTGASGYTLFLREGQPTALGAEWTVDVLASN